MGMWSGAHLMPDDRLKLDDACNDAVTYFNSKHF